MKDIPPLLLCGVGSWCKDDCMGKKWLGRYMVLERMKVWLIIEILKKMRWKLTRVSLVILRDKWSPRMRIWWKLKETMILVQVHPYVIIYTLWYKPIIIEKDKDIMDGVGVAITLWSSLNLH